MVEQIPVVADNFVFLRGVLAADPIVRELPSGDRLCSFRVTVPRPAAARGRVDSIDCSSVRVGVHRSASRLTPGDRVEVVGTLHRRFWRTPTGSAASRYEVDVTKVRSAKGARSAGRA